MYNFIREYIFTLLSISKKTKLGIYIDLDVWPDSYNNGQQEKQNKKILTEIIKYDSNEKELDIVNDLWFYCGICLKKLECDMHLIFTYGTRILSLLLTYNINRNNKKQRMVVNYPQKKGIPCQKNTTYQKKIQYICNLIPNHHQRKKY